MVEMRDAQAVTSLDPMLHLSVSDRAQLDALVQEAPRGSNSFSQR
jgi:hypothetical protein